MPPHRFAAHGRANAQHQRLRNDAERVGQAALVVADEVNPLDGSCLSM